MAFHPSRASPETGPEPHPPAAGAGPESGMMLPTLPLLDPAARPGLQAHLDDLTKPLGALGRLESLSGIRAGYGKCAPAPSWRPGSIVAENKSRLPDPLSRDEEHNSGRRD